MARPNGLAEALWACVLDDYLSEEEEGEVTKVLGVHETSWCGLGRQAETRESTHGYDPRDARSRAGTVDNEPDDEARDDTPVAWVNANPGPELPPILWLSVPEDSGAARKDEFTVITIEPDWEADWEGDWDEASEKKRAKKRLEKKLQQLIPQSRGSPTPSSMRYYQDLDSGKPSIVRSSSKGSKAKKKSKKSTNSEVASKAGSQTTRPKDRSKSRTRSQSEKDGKSVTRADKKNGDDRPTKIPRGRSDVTSLTKKSATSKTSKARSLKKTGSKTKEAQKRRSKSRTKHIS